MTKEEILIEFGCPDIPFDENVTMYYPAILSAMDKYAEQEQAKTIAEHEAKQRIIKAHWFYQYESYTEIHIDNSDLPERFRLKDIEIRIKPQEEKK